MSASRRKAPLQGMVASLVGGAAITVLVAWGCTLMSTYRDGDLLVEGEALAAVGNELWPQHWTRPRSWHRMWGVGVRYDLMSECRWMGSTLDWSEDTHPNRSVVGFRAGWPWSALAARPYDGQTRAEPLLTPKAARTDWRCGVDLGAVLPAWIEDRLDRNDRFGRVLALRPLAPGLAADTLLYAALLWIAWRGAGGLRRGRRRRRNRCTVCGYSLAGNTSGVCSECGHANVEMRGAA